MSARSLDHLVVAVRDLDGAARFYERLGFRVGTRNRHPWGTENRIIQFPGSFIELIMVGARADIPPHGPRRFSFGAFVRDFLARREGLAMLALASRDAEADAAAFAEAGIGDFEPFFFERKARRPDGSETRVAFTLAFAHDPLAPEAGFFVSQHHEPGNFWNAALQRHPNGATGISAVALAVDDPVAHRGFLERFAGSPAARPPEGDLSIALEESRIIVMTPEAATERFGLAEAGPRRLGFAAFAVRHPDVRALAAGFDARGMPRLCVGSRLVVPARGVAIAFEPG
jgi:catechol 2,3-dioxygenase-like lactoylglutathione lyase family enzyme